MMTHTERDIQRHTQTEGVPGFVYSLRNNQKATTPATQPKDISCACADTRDGFSLSGAANTALNQCLLVQKTRKPIPILTWSQIKKFQYEGTHAI